MADVFEGRDDLDPWRNKLWDLILKTPMLDWLLLTKRPENIEKMVPWTNNWPDNIWLGTTVENQRYADERLPHLLKHQSKVRFLSCEPILGEVDLESWIKPNKRKGLNGIDWIIAGGESGASARPMNPNWIRKIRDQAQSAGVPFLFKQWGQWAPTDHLAPGKYGKVTKIADIEMTRLRSKKHVNRELDGATWDEYPTDNSPKIINAIETCKEIEPTDPELNPKFPTDSISYFLHLYRDWELSLDKNLKITEDSKLTHLDFPGISLSFAEFHSENNEHFDLWLAKIYQQAVTYGKTVAKAELKKALQKICG